MKKIIIILFLLLLPSVVGATDYYVRPSGGSYGSEDGTSYDNAWDGLSNINWTTVDDGNGTLWVCGDHTGTMSIGQSGESIYPIIVDGDCSTQGGTDGTIDADGATNAIDVQSRSYVTIRNLYLNNSYDNLIDGDGSSNVIVEYNNLISDNTGDGSRRGMRCQSCTDLTFQYNYFYGPGVDGQPDGIYIQYGSGTTNIIGNKIIIDTSAGSHNDCIQANRTSQTVNIIGNYCEHLDEKTSNSQGIYNTETNGGTWNVIDNVVVLNRSTQAIAVARIPLAAATYNIYNNTVTIKDPQSTSYRLFWFDDNNTGSTYNVKNNICYHTGSQALCWDYANAGSATINHDYNLTYCPNDSDCWDGNTFSTWQNTLHRDENGYNTNPSLDADYRPNSGTDPSVGTGQVLAAEYDDGLSTNMTLATWISAYATVDRDVVGGATWDIGAFEYQSNYYVDYTLGSDSNNGLSGDDEGSGVGPWKTLANVTALATGSDVYFKCGETWPMDTMAVDDFTVDWDGTSSNYVVIGAYYMDGATERLVDGSTYTCLGGAKPIFDGDFARPSSGPTANVGLINQRSSSACWNYIQFQDLRIIESKAEGFEFSGDNEESCSNIRGYRLETYRSYNAGFIAWGDLDTVTISDSVSEEDAYYNCVSSGTAPAVRFEPPASRGGGAKNVTFERNVIKESCRECMNITHVENLIVQDNLLYNNKTNVCVNIVAKWSDEDPVYIRRNLIYQTDTSRDREASAIDAFYIGDGDPYESTDEKGVYGAYIYNNLIAGFEDGFTFSNDASITTTVHDHVYIYANTFVDMEAEFINCANAAAIDFGPDVYIQNNIFAAYDVSSPVWVNSICENDADFDDINFSHNLYQTEPSEADIKGTGDVYSDPLLTKQNGWLDLSDNELSGDEFKITTTSPAYNAGLAIEGFNDRLSEVDYDTWPPSVSYIDDSTLPDIGAMGCIPVTRTVEGIKISKETFLGSIIWKIMNANMNVNGASK